jgi:hypothetical protein
MALNADVMARLAAAAKDVSSKERSKISKFGLRAGVLTLQGAQMPGNAVDVIVLSAVYRNTWYKGIFDPDNIVNPNCFAFAIEKADLIPPEQVAEPVHGTCAGCPKAEWDSDPRPGKRGKACKEGRRLVMIPADVLKAEDPVEAIKTAELGIMDLSVTNAPRYAAFVQTLAATAGVPPYAAVTNVSVTPNAKSQFAVNFTPLSVVPSIEILNALEARIEQANQIGLQAYDESARAEDPEAAAPAAPAKNSKKF